MNSFKNFEEKLKYKKYLESKIPNKKKLKLIKKNEVKAEKLRINQINFDSPNERKFRHLLIEMGVKYIWQQPFVCEKRYVCTDFFIPELRTVIEIDGREHNEEKDLERTIYLKRSHKVKEVLRITNYQLAHEYKQVEEFVGCLQDSLKTNKL